jgi:hypothetical protein
MILYVSFKRTIEDEQPWGRGTSLHRFGFGKRKAYSLLIRRSHIGNKYNSTWFAASRQHVRTSDGWARALLVDIPPFRERLA